MTDINRNGQAYVKQNGKIESGPSASSTLKRNNSYHQRLKKSYSECEYSTTNAGANNNGQQSTTVGRSGSNTGGSSKWRSQTASPANHQQQQGGMIKPIATVKPDASANASADEFKRFHTLRNSYGGKSNLNVNSTNESSIKTQVLLHQQKLKEYSKHAADLNNDSYSTCSSSQSDYQHPQQQQHHSHKHHHRYHHHQHQHHQHLQQQHTQPSIQQLQQHQYPVSATVAANATLTRPVAGHSSSSSILKNSKDSSGGGGSTKNSLRRGAGGLSTLSLCSCDAETEVSAYSFPVGFLQGGYGRIG